MEPTGSSDDSSPPECEPVMDCHLALTALSGTIVIFFLHGYGRCVCREAQVTLDEFEE